MAKRAKQLGDVGRERAGRVAGRHQQRPRGRDRHRPRPRAPCRDARDRAARADRRLRRRSRGHLRPARGGAQGGRRHPEYVREHFGFADGFSQPAIKGNGGPETKKGMGTPGRLGYWRTSRARGVRAGRPWAPTSCSRTRPCPRSDSAAPSWCCASCTRTCPRTAPICARSRCARSRCLRTILPTPRTPSEREKLAERQRVVAAKMMGRWHDGRSLVRSSKPVDSKPKLQAQAQEDQPVPLSACLAVVAQERQERLCVPTRRACPPREPARRDELRREADQAPPDRPARHAVRACRVRPERA